MTDFPDFEWVVWRLEVQDPSQLAGADPDLDERTQETMTELAASLGCVYEHCVDTDTDTDTDTYPEGTPYYAWWVRLPATEHTRRDTDGLPQAIGPLRQYLATQLPDGLKWEITPDREYTVDHAGSVAMRTAYDDLIAPFERALMPLRRDGADALDPRAKVWKWEENLLVGTFDLWLCNDPDRPHTWLVVTVGLWTEPQFFDEEPAARLGNFDFTPHHPLLFLPPSRASARICGSRLDTYSQTEVWRASSKSCSAARRSMICGIVGFCFVGASRSSRSIVSMKPFTGSSSLFTRP
ncbi:hypothetical protein ABT034_33860 [Streptomyces sp. NPDC002773]|uniref:hypothetical protein n=1 Tax=Streptomyces sp. NPDC002773 TaxID=3154430 RepID=UPI00331FEC53